MEHVAILREVDALLSMIRDPSARSNASERSVQQIGRLRELLNAHQTREEQLLLPILQKHADSEVSASVSNEHRRLRNSLEQLSNDISSAEASKGLSQRGEEFASSVKDHFSREENVLFWYVTLHLSRSEENPAT